MYAKNRLAEEFAPRLTEPGVKYYMAETLKVCNVSKHKYYNILFNVTLLVIIVVIFSLILYYRYKGQQSESDRLDKSNKKKSYILGKIQAMQKMKQNNSLDLITNLPIK